MKPTTEDFLIPVADALSRVCPSGNPQLHQIAEATALRIEIAMVAKSAHDAECQRLADKWVEQNEAAYFQKASDSRFAYGYQSNLKYRNNLDAIWNSMRDEADPIFRDYITTYRPTNDQW